MFIVNITSPLSYLSNQTVPNRHTHTLTCTSTDIYTYKEISITSPLPTAKEYFHTLLLCRVLTCHFQVSHCLSKCTFKHTKSKFTNMATSTGKLWELPDLFVGCENPLKRICYYIRLIFLKHKEQWVILNLGVFLIFWWSWPLWKIHEAMSPLSGYMSTLHITPHTHTIYINI